MEGLLQIVERLDLSYRESLSGPYFGQIVGLLSIVFGGSLLLFSWKHHRYFLGMTGFLAGCFAGLLLKANVMPEGGAPHVAYIGLCGIGLGAVCLLFPRLVGMILGGFAAATALCGVYPKFLEPDRHNLLMISIGFTLGGGLGVLFPRLFYILATSLFGAAFVTYGISGTLLPTLLSDPALTHRPLWHAMVLIPLFVFGVCYQLMTTRGQDPDPPPPRPQPARS
jgi:hypothetical protein